jgi:hypothetical protein
MRLMSEWNGTMVTPAQVQLIAWIEFEFIRRTLAVRRGEAPLDWIGTDHRVPFDEIQAQARELGVEEAGDDLEEWIRTVRGWSRWHETINHMDIDVLEHELKERTAATSLSISCAWSLTVPPSTMPHLVESVVDPLGQGLLQRALED